MVGAELVVTAACPSRGLHRLAKSLDAILELPEQYYSDCTDLFRKQEVALPAEFGDEFSAVSALGRLFMFGLDPDTGAPRMMSWNPRTGETNMCAPPRFEWNENSMAVREDLVANKAVIYCLGVEHTFAGVRKYCDVYCVQQDEWRQLPPLRKERNSPVAIVLGDELYVMGGDSGSMETLTVTEYWPFRTVGEEVAAEPEEAETAASGEHVVTDAPKPRRRRSKPPLIPKGEFVLSECASAEGEEAEAAAPGEDVDAPARPKNRRPKPKSPWKQVGGVNVNNVLMGGRGCAVVFHTEEWALPGREAAVVPVVPKRKGKGRPRKRVA
eukprot:TRINITY_DN15513_c0_g1_i2.p1 TRINITY_DN15513_c0_g1~~TRINITY_DN15513_c0_g1_i2.p1  ORF type:complete len:326 (-),score=57.87 TRINITY_DN15513_c0_g1_i2:351-1328(-)